MVDRQSLDFPSPYLRFGLAADRTRTVLGFEHIIVLLMRKPEHATEVPIMPFLRMPAMIPTRIS